MQYKKVLFRWVERHLIRISPIMQFVLALFHFRLQVVIIEVLRETTERVKIVRKHTLSEISVLNWDSCISEKKVPQRRSPRRALVH